MERAADIVGARGSDQLIFRFAIRAVGVSGTIHTFKGQIREVTFLAMNFASSFLAKVMALGAGCASVGIR